MLLYLDGIIVEYQHLNHFSGGKSRALNHSELIMAQQKTRDISNASKGKTRQGFDGIVLQRYLFHVTQAFEGKWLDFGDIVRVQSQFSQPS